MHSSTFKIEGYQGDVVVLHNGDWSGDATVIFREAVYGAWDKQEKPEQRITIPGKLFIAISLPLAKKYVIENVIRGLEQIDVKQP